MFINPDPVFAGLPDVHHIGLVVADLKQSLDRMNRLMGLGPIWSFERTTAPNARFADGTVGITFSTTFVRVRGTLLEVVQPIDDRSPIHAFLRDRGEGIHHLAFLVDGIADYMAHFESLGMIPTINDTSHPAGSSEGISGDTRPPVSWALLEGEAASGMVLELVERNETSEAVFQEIYDVIGKA